MTIKKTNVDDSLEDPHASDSKKSVGKGDQPTDQYIDLTQDLDPSTSILNIDEDQLIDLLENFIEDLDTQ